jgi:hypothetical protein
MIHTGKSRTLKIPSQDRQSSSRRFPQETHRILLRANERFNVDPKLSDS